MIKFENYFDQSFKTLKPEIKGLDTLLKDEKNFMLIAGDFFGIQHFIFNQLSTRNASKVLRAKSAYIQVLTKIIGYYICDVLSIEKSNILRASAGKLEILSPVIDREKLEGIQKEIDQFFLTYFYGLSGLGISYENCEDQDFKDAKRYLALRDKIAKRVEESKFHKFDLTKNNTVMSYDAEIDNQSLCKVCNIRKIEHENCSICDDFIYMGEKLTKAEYFCISKGEGDIEIFNNYYLTFSKNKGEVIEGFDISTEGKKQNKHWAISSYVKKFGQEIATFEELANSSCSEEAGIKALGVLKGDVDDLGTYLRNSEIVKSFESFELFSKSMDNFFSIYVPQILMAEKYPNTYTVFAGGDDIFIIGAWDELIKLSIDIQTDFKKFIKNKLSISMGIIVVKASIPVSYLAEISEEKLEASKLFTGKDALTLFNETTKWSDYTKQREKILALFEDNSSYTRNTSFLYRLLTFIKMRQEIKLNPENSMWKSKLNYSFRRNILEGIKGDVIATQKAENFFKGVFEMIEHHPDEAKMVLSEFIYTRRVVA